MLNLTQGRFNMSTALSIGNKQSILDIFGRARNILLALVFASTQLIVPLSVLTESVQAAGPGTIDVSTHQAQLKDGANGNLLGYTTGSSNITTYSELDSLNIRFDIEANGALAGQMQIEFTSNDTGCLFFDGSFGLGTHDASAPTLTNVTGSAPSISTVDVPDDNGNDWVQVLYVDFEGSGSATVNYYLTFSDEAGECSNGSPQHSRLANGPEPGDFSNIGDQNIPIPSRAIIELPEIFIEKWVDVDGDGEVDRRALEGEWSFSLDGGDPVSTDENGKVVFSNVIPDGEHTITEHNGPSGQSFISGEGDSCEFDIDGVATANVAAGTTAADAICTFNNGVSPGSISITKDAVSNNLTDFDFTATGDGVDAFTLDDDYGVTGSDNIYDNEKTFPGLSAGTYTFTEADVAGWDLTDIYCEDEDNNELSGDYFDLTTATATVDLAPGQNVTCTFKNVERAQVMLEKITDPDGDITAFGLTSKVDSEGSEIFTSDDTFSTEKDAEFTMRPGTYSFTEVENDDWRLTNIVCDGTEQSANNIANRTAEITVAAGDDITCTFTNTKLATLTIVKQALPQSSTPFSFLTRIGVEEGEEDREFTLIDQEDGEEGANTEVFDELMPGDYDVTETFTDGWRLTDVACTMNNETYGFTQNTILDEADQEIAEKINVALTAGDDVTCTFTNTQLLSIGGIKYLWTESGLSRPTATTPWTVELWLQGDTEFEKIDETTTDESDGSYSFTDLLPGIYQLRELTSELVGWTQTIIPADITLEAGDIVVDANLENFEHASVSGYKWNDADGDGVWDGNEDAIKDWTITLERQEGDSWVPYPDTTNNTTQTSDEGQYDFDGLQLLEEEAGVFTAPMYRVCEEDRSPTWEQTYPVESDCHEFTIIESGEGFIGNSGVAEDFNFGNRGFGTITVQKTAFTTSEEATTFAFEVDSLDYDDEYSIDSISVIGQGTESAESITVAAGSYEFTENVPEGWILLGSFCSTEESAEDFTVLAGGNVTCTFVNQELATVNVTKFNDFNGNGEWDSEIEPTLSDWEMTLACELVPENGNGVSPTFTDFSEEIPFFPTRSCLDDTESEFELLQPIDNEFTDDEGVATFTNLLTGPYTFGEVQQDGWQQTGIYCESDNQEFTGNQLFVLAGQTQECFIGNAQDLVLNLDKTNDTPETTVVGDIVTYTLTVSVPEDSGVSYNTTVVDLSPENFIVDNATTVSTLVSSPNRPSGEVFAGINATYASPGTWQLGTLYPGDVVELTYETEILENVSPGTYPDIAYARGGTVPILEENETVYSNVHLAAVSDPFVGTEVTVAQVTGEVLGVQTLARTGAPLLWQHAAIPILLIGLAAALVRRETKGAL